MVSKRILTVNGISESGKDLSKNFNICWLSVMSGLSVVLRKTTFRHIEIFRMYFDTEGSDGT